MPGDLHLQLGGLDYTNVLFMNISLCYCINTYSKLLPNKCMELNETKDIAEVPTNGPHLLYKYFSKAHPILSIIIKIENYKI